MITNVLPFTVFLTDNWENFTVMALGEKNKNKNKTAVWLGNFYFKNINICSKDINKKFKFYYESMNIN